MDITISSVGNFIFFFLWILPLLIYCIIKFREIKNKTPINGKTEVLALFAVNSMLIYSIATLTFHGGLSIIGQVAIVLVLISFIILKRSKTTFILTSLAIALIFKNPSTKTFINFSTVIYWLIGVVGFLALIANELQNSRLCLKKKVIIFALSFVFFGSIFNTDEYLRNLINPTIKNEKSK
jgi:multisubunit Na+/H+ antiporter MnhF subunit